MTKTTVGAIALQFVRRRILSLGVLLLWCIYTGAHGYVTHERWSAYQEQQRLRLEHQESDRQSWESNPDKHPHRMAHFGAFAFRQQHPLSIFDAGLESYMGNVVYLEAHKQNTANFSEASLSTGLIRFGDLHSGMLLYLILPLLLFFIGYDAISREREIKTLKLMSIQGATMRQILLGKWLGLFVGTLFFCLPALCMMWLTLALDEPQMAQETLYRLLVLTLAYLIYFLLITLMTVAVSAWSRGSTQSLLSLLGVWLVCFIILPKTAQAVGGMLEPSPSKLAFGEAVEQEIIQGGDPHNPNDPHYQGVRDSILQAYGVTDIKDLPFNYGGYQMGLGEERSARIYTEHQGRLTQTYQRQNSLSHWLCLVDPYLAIKQVSMGMSATDFDTYNQFLLQSEEYRYQMAQYMNDLQMRYVSNLSHSSEGKANAIDREHFHRFPEFSYRYTPAWQMLGMQALPLCSLVLMLALLVLLTFTRSHTISIL